MSFLFNLIILVVPILLVVAFLTLLERKILSYTQLRVGPAKTGLWGIFQPFSDAVKLITNLYESNVNSQKILFHTSPLLMFLTVYLTIQLLPIKFYGSIWKMSVMTFILLISLMVYPLLITGWSSNSKYALMGSIRGVAQTISYEISFAVLFMSMVIILMTFKLFSMNKMVSIIMLFPMMFFMWLILSVIETNRTPFDFSEGESELVSGFNIEYASVGFVLIFLAEYSSIIMFSLTSVTMFGNTNMMSISSSLMSIIVSMIWIIFRAAYPRYRYDLLMSMAWKTSLPLALMVTNFFVTMSILS